MCVNARQALERLACLAGEWRFTNLQPQIAACNEMLRRRNGIDVAVFGRFKAGKSSFLNHLSGRDVLPIGVVPLTAVVTRMRYGETDRAAIRFLNGTTEHVPLDRIGLYVGENENSENRKQVAAVEVELPELKPLAPLQFVDTPGLGSTFEHNTDAALKWLPNVGAALVAVGADAPLSERDVALLGELRRHTPKIVVLLTKADLLSEGQRAEVLAFVKNQLRRKWEGDLPVFFYSIKPELAVMKASLLAQVLQPLLQHRDEAGGQILRHKLASLRQQVVDYLRVALAAATQAESARQALRNKLQEERLQFALFRQELHVMTRELSANALDRSLERLRPIQRALQVKVTQELQAQLPQWQLRLPRLLRAWRQWLQSFLKRELAGASHSQRAMFCDPAKKAGAHLARCLRAFQDRLASHVRAALGVDLPSRDFNLDVREPSAPPVEVAFAFDIAHAAVAWLIPLTLFHKPIERALSRKARYEVEKNLSRLAADWWQRVGAVIEGLRRQTEEVAWSELEALEQIVAQTASEAPRLRDQIEELEKISVG